MKTDKAVYHKHTGLQDKAGYVFADGSKKGQALIEAKQVRQRKNGYEMQLHIIYHR